MIAVPAYQTVFGTAERPISEGGRWINGSVGVDWLDVRVDSGRAFAAEFSPVYNDAVAVLTTSLSSDQYAVGKVSRVAGYSPTVKHEIELLLRFQIGPHSARGYEVLWGHSGELNVVRWNGPLGQYTALAGIYGKNIGPARAGDLLRAEIVGDTIRVFRNGTFELAVSTLGTWQDGQPGIGFWPKPGATMESYAWEWFEAGSLEPAPTTGLAAAVKQP
jgi:hypothetical protein